MSALVYREFRLVSPAAWASVKAFLKANAPACIAAGKPLRLIVTQDEKKRNVEQNRRYWGLLLQTIAESAWVDGKQFSKDAWHEYFARLYGVCDEVILPGGEIVTRRKSTTQMSVGEFSDYMQQVEVYALSELGVEF